MRSPASRLQCVAPRRFSSLLDHPFADLGRSRLHRPFVTLPSPLAYRLLRGARMGSLESGGSLDWLLRALGDSPPAPDLPRVVGDVVGGYRLGERLGRGSFGVVYEALDVVRGRTVALKLLRADRAPGALAREAMLLGRLDHPNVVALHAYDVAAGTPFLALERLRGEPLDRRLMRAPLGLDAALDIAVAVARGLAHAHAGGVVHADLKPANVFLCDDGAVKLLDFGLAELDRGVGSPADDAGGGTRAYMSPERYAGQGPSYASDVFAMGMLIYELVHGERCPLSGAPSRAWVPARLAALIARALAAAPATRFADGRELLEALVGARAAAAPQPDAGQPQASAA
jgi:serine/threonine protein kinase